METSDLRLDGNAAAGVLGAVFALEMTSARAICAGCGAAGPVGTLIVYAQAPGTVMRCPLCDNPVIRIVHGGGRYWLDLSGARCIEIREPV